MRTTIDLDPDLLERLRVEAARRRLPFKELLNATSWSRQKLSPRDRRKYVHIVDGWLARPNVIIVAPGPDHWNVLRQLLRSAGTAGNLMSDSHLAALAVERGYEVCSTDADFGRFPGLSLVNPLAS